MSYTITCDFFPNKLVEKFNLDARSVMNTLYTLDKIPYICLFNALNYQFLKDNSTSMLNTKKEYNSI